MASVRVQPTFVEWCQRYVLSRCEDCLAQQLYAVWCHRADCPDCGGHLMLWYGDDPDALLQELF